MIKQLLILFFLFTLVARAQDSLIVVSTTKYHVLYRGFPNLVQLAFEKMNEPYFVRCWNCEIDNRDSLGEFLPKHNFFVTPTQRHKATLEVLLGTDTSNLESIGEIHFLVRRLLDPSIYFGNAGPNEKASRWETRFFVKYTPEVLLDNQFAVKTWEFSIGKKVFKGTGDSISPACHDYLKKLKKGGVGQVTLTYIGPDNETRLLNSSISFSSDKELKEILNSSIPFTDENGNPIPKK
jgi:hypothetical protein